jgi:hypothetical protein
VQYPGYGQQPVGPQPGYSPTPALNPNIPHWGYCCHGYVPHSAYSHPQSGLSSFPAPQHEVSRSGRESRRGTRRRSLRRDQRNPHPATGVWRATRIEPGLEAGQIKLGSEDGRVKSEPENEGVRIKKEESDEE